MSERIGVTDGNNEILEVRDRIQLHYWGDFDGMKEEDSFGEITNIDTADLEDVVVAVIFDDDEKDYFFCTELTKLYPQYMCSDLNKINE